MSRKISALLCSFLFAYFPCLVLASTINSLFHHPGDPVGGNPQGKVTVVEFFDYECSHCRNMADVMGGIASTNPNVRLVFKDLPILTPMSIVAARAALAANRQGLYYPFYHALLSQNWSSEEDIFAIAKSVGLNVEKLKADMNSKAISAALNNNLNLARSLDVPGTPAIFVGKTNATSMNGVQSLPGESSQADVQAMVNAVNKS